MAETAKPESPFQPIGDPVDLSRNGTKGRLLHVAAKDGSGSGTKLNSGVLVTGEVDNQSIS